MQVIYPWCHGVKTRCLLDKCQPAHEMTSDWVILFHDDVIKWKHFPRYLPFVREIYRSPVNSPHKGQWRGAFMFFDLRLNNRLNKRSWGWWFETSSCPLWRHCNVNATRKCFLLLIRHWTVPLPIFPSIKIWDRHHDTTKPVYNDHLMGYLSAFWSSSRWPRAT